MLRVDPMETIVASGSVLEQWRRRYVEGEGLGARSLFEETDAGTDPVGADRCLLFVLGLVSGVLPREARHAAVRKSPLPGTFLDSCAGGAFPSALLGTLDDHLGLLVTREADDETPVADRPVDA